MRGLHIFVDDQAVEALQVLQAFAHGDNAGLTEVVVASHQTQNQTGMSKIVNQNLLPTTQQQKGQVLATYCFE